ncbi:hypothetical protein GQ44DRAFT_284742 [Phaeosphaeriaceae sp. PMI808]|nr:hypothetical protein GQ44DRAFT_284742 [Phaeosphaeriaceae sp. PMI808]
MPNLLIMSFEAFSASSRQMYPQLFPKILSRAAVHESVTAEDALNYIGSGWPNIILVSDSTITRVENQELFLATINWVRCGCTIVFMGFFATTIETKVLNAIFKDYFNLKWRAVEYASHDVRLHHTTDNNMIRGASLVSSFEASALYLSRVPADEVVYVGGPSKLAYAAFARVGLGKVGYIGDENFEEAPERLIVAMCHLDRLEDSLQAPDGL